MAVTTGGLPVRLWVWPGDTQDQTVLAEVKADLAGWRLNRTVWVVDAGFTSGDNRKVLTGGGSGFIIAEKLRGNEAATVEARSRQGERRGTSDDLQRLRQVRSSSGQGAVSDLLCEDPPTPDGVHRLRPAASASSWWPLLPLLRPDTHHHPGLRPLRG